MGENSLSQHEIDALLDAEAMAKDLPPSDAAGAALVKLLERGFQGKKLTFEAGQYGLFSDFRPLLAGKTVVLDFRGEVDGVALLSGVAPADCSERVGGLNAFLSGRAEAICREGGTDLFVGSEEVLAVSFSAGDSSYLLLVPTDVARNLIHLVQALNELERRGDQVEVSKVRFGDLRPNDRGAVSHSFDLISEVPLELTVELGRTTVPLQNIMSLTEGSIIELQRLAGEKVDVMIENRLIAKGEVLVVDDNFAVRITDIISPDERVPGGVEET